MRLFTIILIFTLAGSSRGKRLSVLENQNLQDICGQRNLDVNQNNNFLVYHGDDLTSTRETPWSAFIMLGGGFKLSGSIISNYHVLTAGHMVGIDSYKTTCNPRVLAFQPIINPIVVFNETNPFGVNEYLLKRRIKKVYVPINYQDPDNKVCDNGVNNHDIAIVEFKQPIDFSDFVKPICIARSSYSQDNIYEHFGYGNGISEELLTSSYILRQGRARNVECNDNAMDTICTTGLRPFHHNHQMIPMTCDGDSGSGLVRADTDGRFYVYGCDSWGKRCDLNFNYGFNPKNRIEHWTSIYDHKDFICTVSRVCVDDAKILDRSTYYEIDPVLVENFESTATK